MKLFVVAALIAVCSAGRLEHLERSYLPPDNSITSGKHGGSNRGYGSSFDVGSSFAQQQGHPQNSFPNAANRYLPPISAHASNGATQYIGATKGLGGSRIAPATNQQYSIPSTSYGTPQGHGSINGQERSQAQFGAASRQYLTPSLNAKQNVKFVAPSRQYLSPNAGSTQNGHQQFGSASGGQQQQFGSASGGQQQQYGSASGGQQQQFEAATSRQYLAPSAGGRQSGQQQLGNSNAGQQQRFGAAPSRQYLTPYTTGSLNAHQQLGASNSFQQQRYAPAPNRQYLSPVSGGAQRSSQQKFGGLSFGQQQKFGAAANPEYFVPASGSQRNVQQQFGAPKKQYLAPLAFKTSGSSQFKAMIGAKSLGESSRQYLAPNTDSFEGIPQQQFNERTGYQY